MALLEDLKAGVALQGLLPGNGMVTIISVTPHADIGAEIIFKDANGKASELLYQDRIAQLRVLPLQLPWRFDANGALFRLVSEAYRIRLAYLFASLMGHDNSIRVVRQTAHFAHQSDRLDTVFGTIENSSRLILSCDVLNSFLFPIGSLVLLRHTLSKYAYKNHFLKNLPSGVYYDRI
ncbi:hypothetical protein KDH_66210 [Dictyobacter sp. S3.2.2.5]|uniref:DUF4388 domain-containing protein n=1 Tax=Dictyobacter halimunensis TaxID=3026934 RepID=A0ABQ6G3H2_9CHLR|nr:hypothetical protein KDH_66210 [Dictyobacter sp. S3.2.2.5]